MKRLSTTVELEHIESFTHHFLWGMSLHILNIIRGAAHFYIGFAFDIVKILIIQWFPIFFWCSYLMFIKLYHDVEL